MNHPSTGVPLSLPPELQGGLAIDKGPVKLPDANHLPVVVYANDVRASGSEHEILLDFGAVSPDGRTSTARIALSHGMVERLGDVLDRIRLAMQEDP